MTFSYELYVIGVQEEEQKSLFSKLGFQLVVDIIIYYIP